MAECEHLKRCPIWKKFKNNLSYIWINNYCKGPKQHQCARKAKLAKGQPVPVTLLPNNSHLTLNEKDDSS